MTCDAETIYLAALSLPAHSRADLIRRLLASLGHAAGQSAFDWNSGASRRDELPHGVSAGVQADRLFEALGSQIRT